MPFSRYIVKVADLLEAEARSFRAGAVWVGVSAALSLAAAVLGVAGVGFLVYALFVAFTHVMGEPAAAGVIGILLLAGAGGLIWGVLHKFGR